jgi:DNA-binding GntR family transcriptional regulator
MDHMSHSSAPDDRNDAPMTDTPETRPLRRISAPPSMSTLAERALRAMILSGDLRPGERVVENRLTTELGVSRPPLREAMRVLEQQGLLVQIPRKGAIVTPLTAHDIYEIVTLREEVEQLAVRLGVPVRSQERLERLRQAFRDLEEAAASSESANVTERSFDFHLAVVGLAGHRRLEELYRSLSLQLQLCMAMNRKVRSSIETMREDAQRHRPLLDLVEAGDLEGMLHRIKHHGQRTFLLSIDDDFEGHSPESRAWLAQIRREEQEEEDRAHGQHE